MGSLMIHTASKKGYRDQNGPWAVHVAAARMGETGDLFFGGGAVFVRAEDCRRPMC